MAQPSFSNLAIYFQQYGVLDFLLPFILVFTIVFAILQKTKILGDPEKNKNFNVIISLVLGLLFVVPHITGTYPLGYDPVAVLNQALPSVSLVAIAAVMLLLLMGIFGAGFLEPAKPIIALISIGFIAYIFGASLNIWRGPYDIFYWWTAATTELMVTILAFALIVWFITKKPSDKFSIKKAAEGVGDFLGKYMGKGP